jgi:hypothetical protein
VNVLKSLEEMVIVTGYQSDLYDSHLSAMGAVSRMIKFMPEAPVNSA